MNKLGIILKEILRSDLLLPVILIVVYILFLALAKGIAPSSAELLASFQTLYQKYGYEIIFAASFLEALILINLFVPGGGAIVLGAVFARSGQTSLPMVILAGGLGSLAAYLLDFLLGFFGFSDVIKKLGYQDLLGEAKKKLKKFGKRGLLFSFIHPNIASFVALVAGTTSGINLRQYALMALLGTFFWGSVWALVVYALGNLVLELLEKYSFLLIALVILGAILLRLSKRK